MHCTGEATERRRRGSGGRSGTPRGPSTAGRITTRPGPPPGRREKGLRAAPWPPPKPRGAGGDRGPVPREPGQPHAARAPRPQGRIRAHPTQARPYHTASRRKASLPPAPVLSSRNGRRLRPRHGPARQTRTGRDRAATAPRPPHAGRRQGKGVEGPCRRSGADGRGEGLTRVRRILRSPTRGENKMAAKEGKRGAQRKEASRHVTAPTRPRIGGRRGVTFA